MTAYLFVYGTLRTGSRYRPAPDLSRYGVSLGKAAMRGMLYRVGRYPGMVACKSPAHAVAGEVYQLRQVRSALAILDAYEGDEFERKHARATLASGESLQTWVYLYRPDVRRKPRIRSGDFLAP